MAVTAKPHPRHHRGDAVDHTEIVLPHEFLERRSVEFAGLEWPERPGVEHSQVYRAEGRFNRGKGRTVGPGISDVQGIGMDMAAGPRCGDLGE
jgi:hypothetical protein